MTQLNNTDRAAQMADMKSFDEPMPSVGIFWYDPKTHSLFGVRKKELTPREQVQGRGRRYTDPPRPCSVDHRYGH